MRKILLVIGFLFFCFSGVVFAGSELADYQFQLEKYQESYSQFLTAKNKYLKYETLESRKEVEEALQQTLLLRTRTLSTYFNFLNKSLEQTPALDQNTRQTFMVSLNNKISWFENHEVVLRTLDSATLEKLFSFSDEVEKQDFEMRRLSVQVEGLIYLGKVKNLQKQCQAYNEELKGKEKANLPVFQQWLLQTEERFSSLDQELSAAEEQWQSLADEKVKDERNLKRVFLKFKQNLLKSQDFLEEIITFQKEIERKFESGEI